MSLQDDPAELSRNQCCTSPACHCPPSASDAPVGEPVRGAPTAVGLAGLPFRSVGGESLLRSGDSLCCFCPTLRKSPLAPRARCLQRTLSNIRKSTRHQSTRAATHDSTRLSRCSAKSEQPHGGLRRPADRRVGEAGTWVRIGVPFVQPPVDKRSRLGFGREPELPAPMFVLELTSGLPG